MARMIGADPESDGTAATIQRGAEIDGPADAQVAPPGGVFHCFVEKAELHRLLGNLMAAELVAAMIRATVK